MHPDEKRPRVSCLTRLFYSHRKKKYIVVYVFDMELDI